MTSPLRQTTCLFHDRADLARKDAFLRIDVAKELRGQRKPLVEATVEACSLRFRIILMTGFAFILAWCCMAQVVPASSAV